MPSRGYASKPQATLDGPCYADMVDRLWLATADDAILQEFYESVKKNTIFTMNLRPGSGAAGIVSMPADNQGQDWFENCDLYGIVPHIGGAHLAQLTMAQRMAERMGDHDFARQCQLWPEPGSKAMEDNTWSGDSYLLYNDPETGRKSDVIMAYALDGEWMARLHGLPGVFRADRAARMLEAIKRTSIALTDHGAVTFVNHDGTALGEGDFKPGYWGSYGIHPPGTLMLAMTYIYHGQPAFGAELARRVLHHIVAQGWMWDWPVVFDGKTGKRVAGFDYYQNMVVWTLPAVIEGGDLSTPCRPGGLVDKVVRAASRAL